MGRSSISPFSGRFLTVDSTPPLLFIKGSWIGYGRRLRNPKKFAFEIVAGWSVEWTAYPVPFRASFCFADNSLMF